MNDVIRLAIVDPNDGTRNQLKNMLLGIESIWLEAECSRYEFFTDVATQTQPDIALVSLDADSTKGLALISELSHNVPSCSVLVISRSQEGSLILQAMRNGAKEFLSAPLVIDDFLSALSRVQKIRGTAEGDGSNRASQVITVGGVGGGVGCTSLGINLACILAANERNGVAIIDLDLALGDTDVWLDIIPDYTIQDVAENINRLDYSLLKRSLTKHECGAFLLPRPVQIEGVSPMSPDELRRILTLQKATFSHLVIDISKSYSPLDIAAMQASDTVLIVTQLDLPGLRNTVRLLQFCDQDEKIAGKVKVVINRMGLGDCQISLGKATETLGREIFAQIPNDYGAMVESRNNGVPLITQSPKSKLTKAIQQLARSIDISDDNEETAVTEKTKKGIFSFFGGSK